MVMQIRRTMTVGATPALSEGQLSVGMADQPPTAWVGVPTAVNPAGVIPITGLVRTVAGAPQPAGALGQLWWDEDAAQLFVYTGSEWVVAVNPPIPDLSALVTQTQMQNAIDEVKQGVTDGSLAPPGHIGEVITNYVSSPVGANATTWPAWLTLAVPAGAWQIAAFAQFALPPTATASNVAWGLSLIANAAPDEFAQIIAAGVNTFSAAAPTMFLTLAAPVTVYFNIYTGTFTAPGGPATLTIRINALRLR